MIVSSPRQRKIAHYGAMAARTRLVIIGGGFAGLHLVRRLERWLRPGEAEVTLVDRNNYHLFTPLLYQVATGELPPHAVAYPLRHTVVAEARYRFFASEVQTLDVERHVVHTADGPIPYDHVVVAPGSITNDYRIPGVLQYAYQMKDLADAQSVRRRILSSFEAADTQPEPERRRELLTFVVIGAGPVGVELASSMRDLFDHSLRRDYANVDVDRDPEIVLLDGADRVLSTMDERLARIATKRLAEQRIRVQLGSFVSEVGPGLVRTRDGAEFRGNTIVWAGGVKANPLLASLDLPRSRDGRLVVDTTFRVGGRDDVLSVGDAAWFEENGTPLAQLAQVAVLQAPVLAENLVRLLRHQPLVAYRHHEKGDLVALGRTQAAAKLHRFVITVPRPIVFGGFPAWTVWRVNYLMQLLGVRNRASLLSEWLLSFFTTRMVSNTP